MYFYQIFTLNYMIIFIISAFFCTLKIYHSLQVHSLQVFLEKVVSVLYSIIMSYKS